MTTQMHYINTYPLEVLYSIFLTYYIEFHSRSKFNQFVFVQSSAGLIHYLNGVRQYVSGGATFSGNDIGVSGIAKSFEMFCSPCRPFLLLVAGQMVCGRRPRRLTIPHLRELSTSL